MHDSPDEVRAICDTKLISQSREGGACRSIAHEDEAERSHGVRRRQSLIGAKAGERTDEEVDAVLVGQHLYGPDREVGLGPGFRGGSEERRVNAEWGDLDRRTVRDKASNLFRHRQARGTDALRAPEVPADKPTGNPRAGREVVHIAAED